MALCIDTTLPCPGTSVEPSGWWVPGSYTQSQSCLASHFLSPCTKQCKVTHDDDCAVRIRCYLKAGYVHLLIGRAVGGIPVGGIDTLVGFL